MPAEIRRKFARIASLLELADDEFCSVRGALISYEAALPEKIRNSPADVSLDMPSFKALYDMTSQVAELDEVVARAGKGTLNDTVQSPHDSFLERLLKFGIRSVGQLEEVAERESKNVEEFVRYWVSEVGLGSVNRGIGAFYLLYVLAWRTQDEERVLAYLRENEIGESDERDELAERILSFQP